MYTNKQIKMSAIERKNANSVVKKLGDEAGVEDTFIHTVWFALQYVLVLVIETL